MSAGVAIGNLALSTGRATNRRWLTWMPIVLADVMALTTAGTLAVYLHAASEHFRSADYLAFAPALALFLFMFGLMGLYPGIALHPAQELRRIFYSVSATYLILLAGTFFLHVSGAYSRLIFLVSWAVSIILVVTLRNLTRSTLGKCVWWGMPVVVLGTGSSAQEIVRSLQKHSSLGMKVIAMLSDGEVENAAQLPVPLMGGLEMAPVIAKVFGVRYAIVSIQSPRGQEFAGVISRYAQHFDHILIIPDFLNMASLWVSAKDLGGILGLELRQTLTRRRPQICKRTLDLAISLAGGILVLPLMGLLYLAVRLSSKGPIFYSQERIGKNDQIFRAWKLRTMVANAEAVLKDCLEQDPELKREWEMTQKLRNDPRVTWIGKFLRKTSLDELPQIWNIIRGDMSLVGPRPIVRNEIQRYGQDFELYLKVRPGITGLWQVSGRNLTTYQERIQYDSYYVRNWSVWLDLYILGRTIQTVLAREGAF